MVDPSAVTDSFAPCATPDAMVDVRVPVRGSTRTRSELRVSPRTTCRVPPGAPAAGWEAPPPALADGCECAAEVGPAGPLHAARRRAATATAWAARAARGRPCSFISTTTL